MGDKTGIEWSDATWNPLLGCQRVSPGCGLAKVGGCYAERMAWRLAGTGKRYEGLVRMTPNGPRWTGASRLVAEALDQPLRWKRPRRIFVDSMADLFFEGHSNEDIAAVFGVMAACPQHTFQVLTKRPARAREWFAWVAEAAPRFNFLLASRYCAKLALELIGKPRYRADATTWPLPNVWLGVSAENQETADERIPLLLETPAAVRFVSYEPALGPIDFTDIVTPDGAGEIHRDALHCDVDPADDEGWNGATLDWIIAGSESGPGARPAELEWFRSVRSQCEAAGVAFYLKQWVGFRGCTVDEFNAMGPAKHGKVSLPIVDGRRSAEFPR